MINLEEVKCKLLRREDKTELDKLLKFALGDDVEIDFIPESDEFKSNQLVCVTNIGHVLVHIKSNEDSKVSFVDYCDYASRKLFKRFTLVVVDLDDMYENTLSNFGFMSDKGTQLFPKDNFKILVVNYKKYLER